MAMEKDKATSSTEVEVIGEEENNTSFRTAETLLRVVPMGRSLVALLLLIKNSQFNDYGSVSFSNFGAVKYLVYANGICVGYSIISAFLTACPRPLITLSLAWTVFFFDQVLTYVILAAGTVSAKVLYLANKGDEGITWSKACGVYGGFCHEATVSVFITFVAVSCYVVLSHIFLSPLQHL